MDSAVYEALHLGQLEHPGDGHLDWRLQEWACLPAHKVVHKVNDEEEWMAGEQGTGCGKERLDQVKQAGAWGNLQGWAC